MIINPGKGLRPVLPTVRNTQFLVEAIGCFPYEEVLRAVEQFARIDTSSLGTLAFPYPQLFVLTDVIIICTSTAIYEYGGGTTFTSKITGLTEGTTWSFADFRSFIYLTNGKVAVTKSADTGIYSTRSDLPYGTCVGNYNGQVFIGSPNTSASGAI